MTSGLTGCQRLPKRPPNSRTVTSWNLPASIGRNLSRSTLEIPVHNSFRDKAKDFDRSNGPYPLAIDGRDEESEAEQAPRELVAQLLKWVAHGG